MSKAADPVAARAREFLRERGIGVADADDMAAFAHGLKPWINHKPKCNYLTKLTKALKPYACNCGLGAEP